jgi:hypothetical protein
MLKTATDHFPFILLFVLMMIVNHFVYMYGDDYRYASYFGLFSEFKGQVVTFKNIIETQIYDYDHANGRFVINVLLVLLLVKGIEIWRIMNPICVMLLAYAIFYVIYVRLPKKGDLLQTSFISSLILLIHLFIARQTLHYATGAFNYVYPMIFLLVLISFFRRFDVDKPIRHKMILLFFVLIGFLTGWSQEQVSILAISFVVLWMAKNIVVKKAIAKIHMAIFVATLLGFLCLFLAPGPAERAMSPELDFYNSLSMIGKIKHSFPDVMRFFVTQQTIYTVFITIFSAILCYQKSNKPFLFIIMSMMLLPFVFSANLFGTKQIFSLFTGNAFIISLYGLLIMSAIFIMNIYLTIKEKNYLFLALALGFLLANLVMVFTPSTAGGRTAFPAIPLAICFIIFLFSKLHGTEIWKTQFVFFLACCAVLHYSYIFQQYYTNAHIHEERMKIVAENSGLKTGMLKLPPLKNRLFAAYELNDYNWIEIAYKDYYKISDSVEIIISR